MLSMGRLERSAYKIYRFTALVFLLKSLSAVTTPAAARWDCENCPQSICPVCVNGITFQHRCIADCQGFQDGRDGSCEGDDVLAQAPWATSTAGTSTRSQAGAESTDEDETAAADPTQDTGPDGLQTPAGDTARATTSSSLSSLSSSSSSSASQAAARRSRGMVRFQSQGLLYVGSLNLATGPSASVDGRGRSQLRGRMGAGSRDGAGVDGKTDEQLLVRAMRYSVDDGSFYMEASPRQEAYRTQSAAAPKAAGGRRRGLLRGKSITSSSSGPNQVGGAEGSLPDVISRSDIRDTAGDADESGGQDWALWGSTDGSGGHTPAETAEAAAALSAASHRPVGHGTQRHQRRDLRSAAAGTWRAEQSGSVYPFSALAYIRYPAGPGSTVFQRCSGTFITPWDVLTAAHCVWNFNANTGYSGWTVYPGLDGAPYSRPYLVPDYVTFYRTENASANTGRAYSNEIQRSPVNYFDIAVIRVKNPHTAWLGIKYDCGRVSYAKTLTCGYPSNANNFTPLCQQCFLASSQCRPAWMMYNYCWSTYGSSGMGILDLYDTRVLGVLSGGEGEDWDYSTWTPIDAFHFSNLVRWMWQPPSPPPSPRPSPPTRGSPPPPTSARPAAPKPSPSLTQTQMTAVSRWPYPPPPSSRAKKYAKSTSDILSIDITQTSGEYDATAATAGGGTNVELVVDSTEPVPAPPAALAVPDGSQAVEAALPVGAAKRADATAAVRQPVDDTTLASQQERQQEGKQQEEQQQQEQQEEEPQQEQQDHHHHHQQQQQQRMEQQLEEQQHEQQRQQQEQQEEEQQQQEQQEQQQQQEEEQQQQEQQEEQEQQLLQSATEIEGAFASADSITADGVTAETAPAVGADSGNRDAAEAVARSGKELYGGSAVAVSAAARSSSSSSSKSANVALSAQPRQTLCKNGQLRLMDGPNSWSGRLEVCDSSGVWGTVCDAGWGWDDTRVACRQLGFPAGGEAIAAGYFPAAAATTPVHYGNVACLGNEVNFTRCTLPDPPSQCRVNGALNGALDRRADVGLICISDESGASAAAGAVPGVGAMATAAPPPPSSGFTNGSSTWQPGDYACGQEGALRLAPGTSTSRAGSWFAGRLEVCMFGQWGSVCDDDWTNADATVACRQLNPSYSSGVALSRSAVAAAGSAAALALDGLAPGPLSMSIWLSNVDCAGGEKSLVNCPRRSDPGRTGCTHQEDAGVLCFAAQNAAAPPAPPPPECSDDGALRLVPIAGQPQQEGSGRLEVCYGGRYGLVCDNSFGVPEARVACRQLGYTYGRPMGPSGAAAAGDPGASAFIWMDDVDCTIKQYELAFWRLIQCKFSGWGSTTCDPRRRAVGLVCWNDAPPPPPATPATPKPQKQSASTCSIKGDVRIVSKAGVVQTGLPAVGRVEVCSGGVWGAICNAQNTWDVNAAWAVCWQVFNTAAYDARPLTTSDESVVATSPLLFSRYDPVCGLDDSFLSTCSDAGGPSSVCRAADVAGVYCSD